ncbi:uncharacterized protein LOC109816216 isoform X4 [Cajanus cajan]|uniref:uncharacterized protein LOC109816216 isoform X4 n=1 Tax=Cajanus cajan TaxID=3821 RepID=UPI00098D7829|nr:uncharacterized protein LOC109816216 isoform X4 [Cajanus cajan]
MEAETNSPENASAMSVPSFEPVKNIGNEEINFLQENKNDVNTKYLLVEETRKADSSKTGEISETIPAEICQESSKGIGESKEKTGHQPEVYSIETNIIRHTDSEGLVKPESIPKSSELEDESTSTFPEAAIKQGEMAEKSSERDTHEEEESTAIDNDQSCRPQSELEQTSTDLEAIDLTQHMGKDTANNEHTDQLEAPRMDNVITEHSNSEGMLTRESSIKSNHDEEALEKIAESYSVDNSEIKNGGKIMPENAIIKEQENNQLEGSSMKRVITNFVTEGHVTSERTTKLSHDVDEHKTVKPHSIEDLQKKDTSEITLEETTDANQLTDAEIQKSETIVVSEDKAQQTLRTAISVRNEAVEESSQEEIHSEAELAAKYTKEMQKPQNEFNEEETKLGAENKQKHKSQPAAQNEKTAFIKHPHSNEETEEINPTRETEEQEVLASKANEKLVTMDDGKFNQDEAKQIEDPPISNTAIECLPEEEVKPKFIPAIIQCATEQLKQQHKLDDNDPEVIENDKTCIPENELDKMPTIVEEPNQPETEANVSITKDKQADKQSEEHITSKSCTKLSYDMDEQKKEELHSIENLENKDTREIKLETTTDVKQLIDLVTQKSEIEGVPEDEALQSLPTIKSVGNEAVDECSPEEIPPETELVVTSKVVQTPQYEFDLKKEIPEEEMDLNSENKQKSESQSAMQNKEITLTELPHSNEVTTEINLINCAKEQEVSGSDAKEILVIKDDEKFIKEEAKWNEDPRKTQLPNTTTEIVQHDNISETIENDKNCILENELQKMSTILEELDQPGSEAKVGIVKEEQADNHLEGRVNQESSTKLSYDVDEHNKVDPHSENLENKDVNKITLEEHTDAKKLTIVGIEKSETKGVLQYEALQSLLIAVTVKNEAVDQSSQEEIQPETELAVASKEGESELNVENEQKIESQPAKPKEEITFTEQKHSDEVTTEISTNDTMEQEVLASDAKENPVIEEDDGKSDRKEAKWIENPIIAQLPNTATESLLEKDVKPKLSIPTNVQCDTIQLSQQQHEDIELEAFENDKSYIPENETDRMSTVVEEPNQPETKANVNIVKEQVDSQLQGHVTEESSTKLRYDADAQKTLELHSTENLKDASEITLAEATDAKQLTNMEIQKPKIEVSVENEGVDESNQEEIQPEAELAVIFKGVQAPQYEFNVKKEISEGEMEINVEPRSESDEVPTEINLTHDTEEQEVPASHAKEKLVIKDYKKSNQEEEKWIEDPTKSQLPNSPIESLEEEEDQPKVHIPGAVQCDTNQFSVQQKVNEDEYQAIENDKSCTSENEFDIKSTIVEETDQPESEANVSVVKELADNQSKEHVTSESSTKLNYEVDEQRTIESHSIENLENKDASEIKLEEATDAKQLTDMEIQKSESEGNPEVEALQSLPTVVSVRNEAHNESSQDEIQPNEVQTPQYEIDAKMEVPEVQGEIKLGAKNEQKSNSLPKAQNKEITTTEQPHLDKVTAETNLAIDTMEQDVPKSDAKEKLVIKDDEKFDQEDAKWIEDPTEAKLPDTESESLVEEEVQPKLPTHVVVEHDTDQLSMQQKLDDAEFEANENDNSCIPENEFDIMSNVVEEPDQPQSMSNFNIVKEEQADNQSERHVTSESSTRLMYNVNEQKTEESHSVENLGNKDASEITLEGTIDAKQLTGVETQISETEGVPQNEALQSLPATVSVRNEALNESSQDKIQLEAELVLTSKKMQTPQYEFDAKKEILEMELSAENEQKSECQHAAQNEEITFTEEPHSDEVIAKINLPNNTMNQEEVPTSIAKEKLVTEDDGKSDQEEKWVEDPTKALFPNPAIERLPEEVRFKFPYSAVVQHDTDNLSEQLKFDDESEVMENDNSCIPENELEIMSTVVEEPDLPETEGNISTLKEEQADNQSERHVTDSSTKLSYEDEQKTVQSRSIENSENRDATEITLEEATEAKQFTDVEIEKLETKFYLKTKGKIKRVPEEEAQQSLPTAVSIGHEAHNESSQDEIQLEAELESTTKEVQPPQYEFNAKKEIPEGGTELSVKKEQKSESQPAAQNKDITITEVPHSDKVTTEINPTIDTKEQEVPTTFDQEVAKWIDDPTKAQLPNSATECLSEEVQPIFSIPAVVQCDNEKLSQKQNLDNDESDAIENGKSRISESELKRTSIVVEEPGQPESETNICIVKEQANNQSEGHVAESSTRLYYNADEWKTVESHSVENLEKKNASEITLDEATDAKQLTDVEIQKSETKSVLEDDLLQSLPTTALVVNKAVDERSHEGIQPEAELEEVQTPQHEFDVKMGIPKGEEKLRVENEQKPESYLAAQNMEITLTKQTQTNEVTAETNITIDIEDQEVPKSEAKKKLVIEDDGKLDQEEEKLIEDPTIAQLPNTATESLPEEEVQPKLLIPAVVEHNTDQLSQKQKLDNDELEAIENDKSSKPENELDRMSTVVEEQDQTETEANVNIGKEEQADNQSQGHVTPKCSAKLSYDADEHNTIKPHSIENLENKDAHEITFEEATDAKQLTDLEIQKSEIEGVPEDEAIQSFPTAASVRNEAFDESSQEWIQPKAELVTTSREEETELSEENEQKYESQLPTQNKEITFTLLPHLEEATAEINLTKDTKERDEVPTSDAQEKLVFEDEGKSNQKEDNWIEEQTKAQLQNIATKSLSEEEAQPNLPTPAVVQRDTDQLSQQQKLEDDESEMIENDKTCIAENELEKMLTIVEEPDKPETEAIVKIVKEEQANTQTEGHVTAESNTELSYDVNEKETVEPHSVENLENKDASEITLEEETDAKQLTDVEIQKSETKGVPEEEARQSLSTAVSVENEAVDGNSQKEIQPVAELKVTSKEEATDLSEGNEQKSESQLTAQKKEMSFTKKQHSEELTAEINPTNDTKEQEEVPASDAKVKLVIEGDGKSDHEEAKWIEDPTNAQLTNTATESLPKEEVQPKLPILAAVHHETHQLSQQQKLDNDESEAIDNDMSCRPENKHDRMSTVVEEPGQPETKANTSIVKEEHADNQSKEHVIAECGVLEDEDLQSLPTTTSVGNDAVNESCQEEIQLEAELIMTYTKEEQIPQEEFDAEKDTPEEETCQLNVENEQKLESQTAVMNKETTFIDHPYPDGETEDVNPSKDKQEQEVPSSHTKEKVVIKGDENFDQMEAKGTEEATKMQLLNTEIERLPEEEVQPKLHNPAIVEDDTEQILQKQTLQDNESEAVDTADNDIPKIIIDKMSTVVEEPNKPETKPNVGIVKEEQADNQSEGSSMQSVTTNFAASEGHVTSKSSTKLSYDVDEQKMVKPQSIENLENKDASDITLEEVTNAKQLTDEIQKSEIEDVPENKALQTLTTAASSVINEAVGESSQEEIQSEQELAVTYTKEVQTLQYQFDLKKDIHEEETCQLSAENKHKSESKSAVQNEETTFTKQLHSDGEAAKINPNNDTEEQDVQVSYAKEQQQIKEDGKFDQEEADGIEEANKVSLLNIATESLPHEEVQPKLATPVIAQGDTNQILPQHTLHKNEGEVVDNAKKCIPEKELDRMSIVVEEHDQPETKANVILVKEEQAYHQSEGSSKLSVITNHITAEEQVQSDSSTNFSYNVDEQKKEESHTVEHLENKDTSNITENKAKDAKQLLKVEGQKSETKGVPEDKVLQILPNKASVGNEAIDESSQEEERQLEVDFAVIFTKEVRKPQYEYDAEKDIPKEETCQLNAGNEQKSDSLPAVKNVENTFIKQPYSYGETAEIKSSNDTEEQENFPSSQVKEKLGIEDDGKFHGEEAKGIEEAAKMKLLISAIESLPKAEVQPKLPTPAIAQGDTDQILHQQTLQDDESEAIDNAKSCISENKLQRMCIVIEDPDQPEAMANISTVKEEQADHQSEASSMQSAITNYINAELVTSQSNTKLCYNVDEQKTVDAHTVSNLEIKDANNITAEEATDAIQLTEVDIQKSKIESVHEDTAPKTLSNAASIDNEAVDEHSQEEIPLEAEFAVTHIKELKTPAYEFNAKKDIPQQAIDQLENMNKVGEDIEEHSDHRLEASSMQGVIAKHINEDDSEISEGKIKSCYDVDRMENIVELHLIKNLQRQDGCKNMEEEATNKRQLTDLEIQKYETQGVPEDKALQTLLSTASASIEEVDKSIRPTHTEAELAVTNTKEEQISENESEVIKEVSEYILKKALHLHKVTCQTSAGNEQKDELLPEQHSQESILTKHPNLEGETIEIKPTNETEELEKVPVSHMVERLEINDDGNSIQEEEKEMEKAVERQLLETVTESVPEDEAQTTIPESTIFKGEMIEGNVQEQTLMGEESAAIDNNSGTPENELEQMANVVETIDQHETMENVITKHINSEGTVTTKNSSKSTNDVEELEKALNSDSIDNSEINNGRKIIPEEESAMKETTDVPEGKAISTSSSRPSLGVEIVEESIHEEIQKEAEPAVTNAKEVQRPDNDFVKNMEVLEAFDLHKASGNTCVENEKKAEVQSETKSQETLIIKNPNLEGLETAEASPSNDTNELEKETEIAKLRGVSESESADITEKTDTGNLENQEAETTQLSNTKDDEGGEEFEKISPSSSISVISRDSQDTDTKVSHKKSHGILSGVGSKVKHSISKVKKAITGKSSHQKTSSPKETK